MEKNERWVRNILDFIITYYYIRDTKYATILIWCYLLLVDKNLRGKGEVVVYLQEGKGDGVLCMQWLTQIDGSNARLYTTNRCLNFHFFTFIFSGPPAALSTHIGYSKRLEWRHQEQGQQGQ